MRPIQLPLESLRLTHASGELTNEDFHDIIEHVGKTYPEGSELVMTLAERFQEKGRKQGIEQGRSALAKAAIKLITKYVAPPSEDVKEKLFQQEISTLENIIEHVDEYNTIEEVNRNLK